MMYETGGKNHNQPGTTAGTKFRLAVKLLGAFCELCRP
jgi:hypothetical protein